MPESKVHLSTLRDPSLAPEGHKKIDWVARHMPVLNEVRKEFEATRPLAGRRIAICLHLEAKTAYMATVLAAGGAEVAICGSNPLSTQDDVCAALAERGVIVHAWHGATPQEYVAHIHKVLDHQPDLVLDDGGDLVATLHRERRELLPRILGGTEETTTGVHRLRAMAAAGALAFPMVAVNNAHMKFLFDNRYGTGQSTWDGIMRNTNLTVAGKTVVVAGYGWCGKGVAMRARGLGARVIVTETDPIAANEAIMDGFEVMPMSRAAAQADFIVTVTGNIGVVREEHLQVIKDGCILANAGHFDVEIDKRALEKLGGPPRRVRENVDEYRFADGRRVYLLAEGRLVNLAGGDGHPAEIMDLSFAVQCLAQRYIAENAGRLERTVLPVPPEIDRRVAELRLRALGVEIDRLTPEQEAYLRSWQGG
ncbi:MAG: adenosylhomocysteinase [Firmicutes bacterium]|nr:adenosylhomocysteinase [Bacillota bacterium]